MASLQASDIGDLITNTINELGRMKFTDITTDIRRHVALTKLLKPHRQGIQSGPLVQFNLMTDHNHSARAVGLGAVDDVDIPDLMIQGQVPWRHVTANWAVEHRVIDMNRNPARIVDIVKEQRYACLISIAEFFEERVWRVPSASDNTNMYGIPYWVVKNNTEGFNGGAASGYTTVGGLDPTAASTRGRWKNWTFQYTAITKEDLIAKWWKAATYCDFAPAVEGMTTFDTGEGPGYYTNYDVTASLKQVLEAQNDDLGNDLDSMDGRTQFRRIPVTLVQKLDDDTTNPIYGLTWGEMKMMVLDGWWMRETKIPVQPNQHTVSATHVDCTMNLITRNRRRHFVGATNTGLPA
ncbi:MAG TPA: phage major capsid protein [Gemmata sp.]|jgi:hypothetical protein|nr:phage major capsid protein [Gemmata sp.]